MVSAAVEQVSQDNFRALRKTAQDIAATLRSDLEAYRHPLDKRTFLRHPDSEVKKNDVGVTTTASAVMALATAKEFARFFGPDYSRTVQQVFADIGRAK